MTNIATALKAIGLVALVVVFNLGLYIFIHWLSDKNIIDGQSLFPPLVLFLSFALSVGIILIVALGEKINSENIENEWIKKIGVTPIMTIIACLLSIALGFSPLAEKLFPDGGSRLKFMLANIGVTCGAADLNKSPEATHLLTVVSSDAPYIHQVKDYFKDKGLLQITKNPDFAFVSPKNGGDELYKILKKAKALQEDLDSDDKWIAYTVKLNAPNTVTSLPVPTIYGRSHKSRLFVVVIDSPTSVPATGQAELASLAASTQPIVATKRIVPLFQFEMLPLRPKDFSQETDLDIKIFADHICWHIGA
jgi:hypothetical protein